MIFGPYPVHFVNTIRQKLQAEGRDLRVLTATEELEKFRQENQERRPTDLPTYNLSPDLIYIEIEQKDLLIVKSELEKMGATVFDRPFDPEFAKGEYLCPKCDFLSESQGLCPKHKILLLEFSAYAEAKRLRRRNLERYLAIMGLAAAALIWLVLQIKKATSPSPF